MAARKCVTKEVDENGHIYYRLCRYQPIFLWFGRWESVWTSVDLEDAQNWCERYNTDIQDLT